MGMFGGMAVIPLYLQIVKGASPTGAGLLVLPIVLGISAGSVLSGSFVLDGARFIGINGGPQFPFSEAVSFTISCKDQDEVDYYWDRLTDGGEESQCGWCKDRFGVSWQVVPDRLYALVSNPDPAQATAAAQAMYGMRKIVIAELEEAAAAASGEFTR